MFPPALTWNYTRICGSKKSLWPYDRQFKDSSSISGIGQKSLALISNILSKSFHKIINHIIWFRTLIKPTSYTSKGPWWMSQTQRLWTKLSIYIYVPSWVSSMWDWEGLTTCQVFHVIMDLSLIRVMTFFPDRLNSWESHFYQIVSNYNHSCLPSHKASRLWLSVVLVVFHFPPSHLKHLLFFDGLLLALLPPQDSEHAQSREKLIRRWWWSTWFQFQCRQINPCLTRSSINKTNHGG